MNDMQKASRRGGGSSSETRTDREAEKELGERLRPLGYSSKDHQGHPGILTSSLMILTVLRPVLEGNVERDCTVAALCEATLEAELRLFLTQVQQLPLHKQTALAEQVQNVTTTPSPPLSFFAFKQRYAGHIQQCYRTGDSSCRTAQLRKQLKRELSLEPFHFTATYNADAAQHVSKLIEEYPEVARKCHTILETEAVSFLLTVLKIRIQYEEEVIKLNPTLMRSSGSSSTVTSTHTTPTMKLPVVQALPSPSPSPPPSPSPSLSTASSRSTTLVPTGRSNASFPASLTRGSTPALDLQETDSVPSPEPAQLPLVVSDCIHDLMQPVSCPTRVQSRCVDPSLLLLPPPDNGVVPSVSSARTCLGMVVPSGGLQVSQLPPQPPARPIYSAPEITLRENQREAVVRIRGAAVVSEQTHCLVFGAAQARLHVNSYVDGCSYCWCRLPNDVESCAVYLATIGSAGAVSPSTWFVCAPNRPDRGTKHKLDSPVSTPSASFPLLLELTGPCCRYADPDSSSDHRSKRHH